MNLTRPSAKLTNGGYDEHFESQRWLPLSLLH